MSSIDIKKQIELAIKNFNNGNLTQNSINLFESLGYNTERQSPLDNNNFKEFEESYIKNNSNVEKFDRNKALISEWKYIDLLFQLSKQEVLKQVSLFDTKKLDNTIIESYLFFAIELKEKEYSRSKLAQITREINKLFPMPVMVLFKYVDFLSLAVINRRLHKKDESKDVLEKVTLIKDIDIKKPNRGHIEILFDISFEELEKDHRFTNFVELHNAWQKTLDTKELNKRFFRDLSNWFFYSQDKVKFPNEKNLEEVKNNQLNLIRLITRLIFVWFLKEKNLVDEKIFDKNYIKSILNDFKPNNETSKNYYLAILQNLFFATLNQKMGDRRFVEESNSFNKKDHGIKNLYRYPKLFNISENEVIDLFKDIPFLNGGLFDCLDKDNEDTGKHQFVDGFTRKEKNQAFIPDFLLFGEERKVDLTSIYGTKKNKETFEGIIEIFKSYKFTIEENTPIEEEVALDPELLGKVFENLLAYYNPETSTTARKQTGSFYTPREIVNYMVDESLIQYLKSQLLNTNPVYIEFGKTQTDLFGNESKIGQLSFTEAVNKTKWEGKESELENNLRDLLSYNDIKHSFDEKEVQQLIFAIDHCKILDPACGSGAFPMGVLNKLVYLLSKIDNGNKHWRELQKKKAQIELTKALNDTDKKQREEKLIEINETFENNASDFGRKLFLIENCIYGVDIQPIAVQISKLRFFISLIVEQNEKKGLDNRGIRPLPNLETKFVSANTLIGLEKPTQLPIGYDSVYSLQEKLQEVRHNHFEAKTRKEKLFCQKKDKEIRTEISDLLISLGFPNEDAKKISKFDIYDQNNFAEWFESEWMFGKDLEKGFDIVIGNPPYGVNFDSNEKKYLKSRFDHLVQRIPNSYLYFNGLAFNVLKEKGVLSFIIPNEFLFQIYMEKARKYFLNEAEFKLAINLGEDVFDAIVPSCIILIKKNKISNYNVKLKDLRNFELINIQKELMSSNYSNTPHSQILTSPNSTFSFDENKNKIISNILRKSKNFEYFCDDIANGISTGCDSVYIVNENKVNENKFEKEYLKPTIRGNQFNKYYCPKSTGDYLLYITPDFDKEKAPNIYRYLEENKEFLINKSIEKKEGNRKWYLLFRHRNENLFKSPKIIVRQTGDRIIASFDSKKSYFCIDSVNIVKLKDIYLNKINLFIGILNSQLLKFIYQELSQESGRVLAQVKPQRIKQMPIIETSVENRNILSKLVDYVIFLKDIKNNDIYSSFFERLINAVVYELYLPDEIKFSDSEVLKYLNDLPELENTDSDNEKLKEIEEIYKKLSNSKSFISRAIFKMDTIEEIRIIEGK